MYTEIRKLLVTLVQILQTKSSENMMISFAMRHENKLLNRLTRMRTKFVEKMKTALIMNIRVCDWPYKSNKKK